MVGETFSDPMGVPTPCAAIPKMTPWTWIETRSEGRRAEQLTSPMRCSCFRNITLDLFLYQYLQNLLDSEFGGRYLIDRMAGGFNNLRFSYRIGKWNR